MPPPRSPDPERPGVVVSTGQKGYRLELHAGRRGTGEYDNHGSDWRFVVNVAPARDELDLRVGVWYDGATNYDCCQQGSTGNNDTTGNEGFLSVWTEDDYCEKEQVLGRFIVREATPLASDDACDVVRSFALDFEQSCDDGDGDVPPLFGFVRVNSSIPIDEESVTGEYFDDLPVTSIPTQVDARYPTSAPASGGSSPSPTTTPVVRTDDAAPTISSHRIAVAASAGLLVSSVVGRSTRSRFPDPDRNPIFLATIVLAGAVFGIVGGAAAVAGCLLTQRLLLRGGGRRGGQTGHEGIIAPADGTDGGIRGRGMTEQATTREDEGIQLGTFA